MKSKRRSPVTEHDYSCDLCKSRTRGGIHVLKPLIKIKYYYHLFQHRHNQLLQQDCICEELKMKLRIKAIYHNSKAVEIGLKM